MGIPPDQAKRLTMWEFGAVTKRWVEAHDTGEKDGTGKLDEGTKDDIWNWMQSKTLSPPTLREARMKANGNASSNGHGKDQAQAG